MNMKEELLRCIEPVTFIQQNKKHFKGVFNSII